VGPRTVLKCSISGIKFVRNRVSIMTAALELFVVLVSEARTILSWGLDFVFPFVLEGCVDCAEADAEGEGVLWEE